MSIMVHNIDPRFQFYKLSQGQVAQADSAAAQQEMIPVIAKVNNLEVWKQLIGVQTNTQIPGDSDWIITARVPFSQFEYIQQHPCVISMEMAQKIFPTEEDDDTMESNGEIRSNPTIYSDGSSIDELYYVVSIPKVHTIFIRGILSKKRDNQFKPIGVSKIISNTDREEIRKKPLNIQQYARLYIRAHNVKMYAAREELNDICVLRVDPQILFRKEVVISDRNPELDETRFYKASTFRFSPESSSMLKNPLSLVWEDTKTGKEKKRMALHLAEALVPYQIHPSFIRGIYVANEVAEARLTSSFPGKNCPVPIDIHPSLFFSESKKVLRGMNPLEVIYPAPLNHTQCPEIDMSSPQSSDDEHNLLEYPEFPS